MTVAEKVAQLKAGPPTCGNSVSHDYSECALEEAGKECYALMGIYEDDARNIDPSREKWYRARIAELLEAVWADGWDKAQARKRELKKKYPDAICYATRRKVL